MECGLRFVLQCSYQSIIPLSHCFVEDRKSEIILSTPLASVCSLFRNGAKTLQDTFLFYFSCVTLATVTFSLSCGGRGGWGAGCDMNIFKSFSTSLPPTSFSLPHSLSLFLSNTFNRKISLPTLASSMFTILWSFANKLAISLVGYRLSKQPLASCSAESSSPCYIPFLKPRGRLTGTQILTSQGART